MSTCGIDAIVISFISYTNCPMPDLEATDKPCCSQRPPKKKKLGCPPPQWEPIIFGGTHPYHVCKAGFPRAINIDRGAQNPWELRCKIVCGEMFQAVHHYTSVQAEPWKIHAFFGRSPIGHLTIWIHGLIAIDIAD